MSSSSSSRSSNSNINWRMVSLSVISFTIGLQFKSAIILMASESGNDIMSDDGAWAPSNHQDVDAPIVITRSAMAHYDDEETAEEGKARRRRKRREQKEQKLKESGIEKKTKKPKPPPLYSTTNYTDDFEPLPWTLPQPTKLRDVTSEQFMKHYIAAKRLANISLPWEEKDTTYADKKVSLPLPIISLNFPKSATLTMKTFFDCGGITSIHTSTQSGRIGICMMENQFKDLPPMHGCDTHKDRDNEAAPKDRELKSIDFISDIGLQGPPCYYASVHDGGLENIAKHYPGGTILLVTRNATSWARSIGKWGSILHRWKKVCGFDGHIYNHTENMKYWNNMYQDLPFREKDEYWVNFYLSHTQKIRDFAMKHLSMTYVEVELENEEMGNILHNYTKVSPDCVMDCHPGPKWVRQNNATSRCHPVGQPEVVVNGGRDVETDDNTDDGTTDDDDTAVDDGEK